MSFCRLARVTAFAALVPAFAVGQESPATGTALANTKIAIIDIERIAAESNEGKKLFEQLKAENDKIMEERSRREAEIRDITAKANSEILSQDARVRLQRDIQRKQTEAQRWLEDAQAEFEAKRQEGEAQFQEKLAPIVEAVAVENGIGLIFRATPGLTFVLDPGLDISSLVVKKLDETAAAGSGTPEP